LPSALPDPTANFSEAAYAAFVYDGGLCEVSTNREVTWTHSNVSTQMCGKNTNEFYVSFAARIRLCRDVSVSFPPPSYPR
jgi:hypothetical protein